METILKEGYHKIILLFYINKSAEIHLREIARKTKLNENSVSIFLSKLEKMNYLSSKKEGNLKKYRLNHNLRTYSILTLLDIDKFQTLPNIRKEAIQRYFQKLPEQPVFALLFGSTAKENYRQDSDIDILIITNNKISAKEAEKEADALCAIKISTFQMTWKDFQKEIKLKEDSVVQSALQTGYPLINHIYFYEVLNERI
ncbi:nucleotidyltransferase domain-containing protein [Candidatus Woesearchaeota archaeon]|nr:hypothetical protein [uncultured archaeon]MBS3124413.1 nucleotidyltransferase domain-containing protein [Candidatus Woesearchaeota archaeon]